MNQSTYFCDHCYKEDHNNIKTFFNRYGKSDYTRHLKTKKHLKQLLQSKEKDDSKMLCKECNTYFSKEGYEVHKKRNQSMWDMNPHTIEQYKWTCNNFVVNGKRFGSKLHWSKWLDLEENKVPQKRKSKKSIQNNNYTITDIPPTYEESEKEESDKEESDKEESDKEVESDYDENCGERPIFKNICDDPLCGLSKNDEDYSPFHLEKWNIDICRCEDTTDDDTDDEPQLHIKVI